MNSSYSSTALYIGVPVLIGASCCYLYYINRNKLTSDTHEKSEPRQLTPKEQLAKLKQTGNHNFSRKNYDVAIDSYTQAISLGETLTDDVIKSAERAIFYQNRAACNEALGKYDEVIADCDQAIEFKNDYVKAYVRRAKAYEKIKNYDKAMIDAFAANLLDKFQNQSNMLLAENIAKASSKLKAAAAMSNRKPSWPAKQTIKAFFSAFTYDPIKEKLGNPTHVTPEQLQELLDEANKPEHEKDPFSMLVRGSCLSLMGDLKNARQLFDEIIKMSDEECPFRYRSNALIKKAAVVVSEPTGDPPLNMEKDLENVIGVLEQAIKLDPENPDVYLHKSQALALSEKIEEAIEALEKAIALKSDFLVAIAQKYYIEFKLATRDPSMAMNKIQDLLNRFKEAIQANPTSIDLHQMYAQVLTELNYFDQAEQVLLDMSKIDPSDGNIYVSRALLQFHKKNDQDEAANLIREALKIDPKILFAYEILGSIEIQRGKIDEAVEIFETALKYAESESDYSRCYNLLDSAKSQKAAAEMVGMQI